MMRAKRRSPIVSLRFAGGAGVFVSRAWREGEVAGELRLKVGLRAAGRHFRTASTEARHGCTWRG